MLACSKQRLEDRHRNYLLSQKMLRSTSVGIGIVIGLMSAFAQALECPDGYTLNGNICYDFRATAFSSYADCNSFCASSDATLLCVQNLAQHQYIYSHRTTGSPWIGLEKIGGLWVWFPGCTSSYTNFGSGEGVSGEPYVVMYTGMSGQWADVYEGNVAILSNCFCQRDAFERPTSQPSLQPSSQPSCQPTSQPVRLPSSAPSGQPSALPSSQPSSYPSSRPSSQPTHRPTEQPSNAPSSQPSASPSAHWMLQILSSKSYQVRNGFSFAAMTSTGAVLYWAGDGTMAVQSVVASGASAAAANRHAVVALTSAGNVEAAGVDAYFRDYEAYQSGGVSLKSVVGNEGAFAGITAAGAAVAFGTSTDGNSVQDSGFAAQLSSGVISIVASAASFTALKIDGTVFTWGNKHCGGGVSSLSRTDLQGIVKVFATRTAFAGLTSAGKVLTWGDRNDGGDSSTVSAQLQSGVFHIVSSQSVFVAMKNDQSVVLWGNPWFGGDASTVATQLAAEVTFVAHSSAAFAALREDGSVVTWGKAASGGDSSAVQPQLVRVKVIVASHHSFAAITNTGAVVVWGKSAEGGQFPAGLQGALSANVTEVFSTNRAFAALKGATGELVLWGNPNHGGDAGAAAAYLTSGVRTVCGNDVAFTAFLQDERAVAWGHATSVPQPGLLHGGAAVLTGAETVSCLPSFEFA